MVRECVPAKSTRRCHFTLAGLLTYAQLSEATMMLKKVLRVWTVQMVSVKWTTNWNRCDTTMMHFPRTASRLLPFEPMRPQTTILRNVSNREIRKRFVIRDAENKWCAVYDQDECVALHLPSRSDRKIRIAFWGHFLKPSAIAFEVFVKKNFLLNGRPLRGVEIHASAVPVQVQDVDARVSCWIFRLWSEQCTTDFRIALCCHIILWIFLCDSHPPYFVRAAVVLRALTAVCVFYQSFCAFCELFFLCFSVEMLCWLIFSAFWIETCHMTSCVSFSLLQTAWANHFLFRRLFIPAFACGRSGRHLQKDLLLH